MLVKLVYSETKGSELLDYLQTVQDIELVALNEDYYKDKKKAIQLKASCGTKLTPFVGVYNEDKDLIKAFYTEVNECIIENIAKYLKPNE